MVLVDCVFVLIVFMMVFVEFFMVIVRFDIEFVSDMLNGDVVLFFIVMLLFGVSMLVLISSVVCVCWLVVSCVDSDVSDVFNCVMLFIVLICVSCDVICELLIGLVGFWFCNCVMSSFRNVVCRLFVDVLLVDDMLLVFIVLVGSVDMLVLLLLIVVLEEVILGGFLLELLGW